MVAKEKRTVVTSDRIMASERVKRLREATITAPLEITAERSHILTEYYRRSDDEPVVLRRAKAFKEVLQNIPIAIRVDELIVGGMTDRVRGLLFYPEFTWKFLQDEMETLSTREVAKCILLEKDKQLIWEDIDYWQGRSLGEKREILWREQYGSDVRDALDAKLISEHLLFPVGRRTLDYEKVLNIGINGIIEEARSELRKIHIGSYEDLPKRYFLQAAIICLEAVIIFAERHAALARELAAKEKSPTRKQELEGIAEVCAWVPANPARTFHEALQSFWFTFVSSWIEGAAAGHSPGRFDQYMYPFYERDSRKGILTKEQALEYLGCLWVKFNQTTRLLSLTYAQKTMANQYQNIVIGGQTRDGKSAVNEMSYLILDVEEQFRLPQPTISVRYNDMLPGDFLLRAAEIIRLGGGKPAWFNDRYAAAVIPYYGVSLEEARDWTPIGCVEIGIPATTSFQYGFGFYNVAKCLELALSNGIDPRTKKQLGPATGDARQFKSYEELFNAVKAQLARAIELAVLSNNTSYALHAEMVPTPYSSALMNDCIKRGKDITEGGVRYNNFIVLEPHGFVNTANSLCAVKKLVYEDRAISMDELLAALANDFDGKDELRSMLEAAPKYGNDGIEAEQVLTDLFQFCMQEAEQYRGPFGDPVRTAFLGITMHYFFGATIGALPDGRKAYTPTADGSLSAFPGTDRKGPTALINSAARVNAMPALSTLLNMKFHPTALRGNEGLKKLVSLIKTYFDLSGYHIQFNVVSRETLLDAKKNPHLHRDLLVRIAGFTVFWVDLPPAIQDEIISRTEHAP